MCFDPNRSAMLWRTSAIRTMNNWTKDLYLPRFGGIELFQGTEENPHGVINGHLKSMFG
jgi:hypothetical protein